MNQRLFLVAAIAAAASGQIDDFRCPDEQLGFYPHLYSCDKYWYCEDGIEELRTCGNGLAFIDTDPSYKLEQCNELYLVDCGARTELEPAISTTNCPYLYGTFADPQECGVFWNCQDGVANRYECPPGLAYDQVEHSCRWINEVPECSSQIVSVDDQGGEFQCPPPTDGVFTKHAHIGDCAKFFLCIGGVPREQSCPNGEVFSSGSGSGIDGQCAGPESVPECANYYAKSSDYVF
eukprot:TRINITY_DN191_c0_g1_i2.p1 TRINITY_DN191_c0_g1~~TRINITY_DN191_c0_g1_i2.p1  ORF type:complete len:235 (-),score=51.91 TRINITY_DN191_c0_g1_i2:80-784(-)